MLLDGTATKKAMVNALGALISKAKAGDGLVITFATTAPTHQISATTSPMASTRHRVHTTTTTIKDPLLDDEGHAIFIQEE